MRTAGSTDSSAAPTLSNVKHDKWRALVNIAGGIFTILSDIIVLQCHWWVTNAVSG